MIILLLELFAIFFQIGLLSFGGGYAALPLIQSQMVDVTGWLTADEMFDLMSISQMTPGPIAINTATFVGTRVAGIAGSITATIGLVAPSMIIVLLLSFLYYKYRDLKFVDGLLTGVRPAVVSMIALAALGILTGVIWEGLGSVLELTKASLLNTDILAMVIFAAAFTAVRALKLNSVLVMLVSGFLGFILYGIAG